MLNQCLHLNQAKDELVLCRVDYENKIDNMVSNFQEAISVVKMKVKDCEREIHQLKQKINVCAKRKEEVEAKIASHEEILDHNNSLNRKLTLKITSLKM